jgi:hypothetical protein
VYVCYRGDGSGVSAVRGGQPRLVGDRPGRRSRHVLGAICFRRRSAPTKRQGVPAARVWPRRVLARDRHPSRCLRCGSRRAHPTCVDSYAVVELRAERGIGLDPKTPEGSGSSTVCYVGSCGTEPLVGSRGDGVQGASAAARRPDQPGTDGQFRRQAVTVISWISSAGCPARS